MRSRSREEGTMVHDILRQFPQYQLNPEYIEWNRPADPQGELSLNLVDLQSAWF